MSIKNISIALAMAICSAFSAQAATVTSSTAYFGELCSTDETGAPDDLNDCATIPGNVGILGVYDLMIFDLDPNVVSDAHLSLTVKVADLFSTGDTAEAVDNNPNERFRLFVDGVDYGLLFDESTADEAAVNQSLADSVQENIDAAAWTADQITLDFVISLADFAPLIKDGALFLRVDFRDDLNINTFRDMVFTVSYETGLTAVPAPASLLLLLSGIAGIAAVRKPKAA